MFPVLPYVFLDLGRKLHYNVESTLLLPQHEVRYFIMFDVGLLQVVLGSRIAFDAHPIKVRSQRIDVTKDQHSDHP